MSADAYSNAEQNKKSFTCLNELTLLCVMCIIMYIVILDINEHINLFLEQIIFQSSNSNNVQKLLQKHYVIITRNTYSNAK